MPENERIFMNNGAASCVAVQGSADDPAVEIPDARLVRLGRVGHRLPAHAIPVVADELLAHTANLTGQPPDHDRSVR